MGTFNMCVINILIELNFIEFNNIAKGKYEENVHIIVIYFSSVKIFGLM